MHDGWQVVLAHVSEIEVPVRLACLVAHSSVPAVLCASIIAHIDSIGDASFRMLFHVLQREWSSDEVAFEPADCILALPVHEQHTLVCVSPALMQDLQHVNSVLA